MNKSRSDYQFDYSYNYTTTNFTCDKTNDTQGHDQDKTIDTFDKTNDTLQYGKKYSNDADDQFGRLTPIISQDNFKSKKSSKNEN